VASGFQVSTVLDNIGQCVHQLFVYKPLCHQVASGGYQIAVFCLFGH
jgi:hypothetical protein